MEHHEWVVTIRPQHEFVHRCNFGDTYSRLQYGFGHHRGRPKDIAKTTAMENALGALSEDAGRIKDSTEAEDKNIIEQTQSAIDASMTG